MTALAPQEGDELPSFQRKTSFPEWNRFAAVNDEFVPIHMDDAAAHAAGMPGAIGMGLLQVAYMHNMVRDWLADRGRVRAFSCRFNAPNLKDQVVTASGRVSAVTPREGSLEADLEIWIADETGQRLSSGTCSVVLNV